jgi:hypothetical protein
MAPSHRKPFTVVDPFSGRARCGSPQDRRSAHLRSMQQADAPLSGTSATFSGVGRRLQCRLPPSRSEVLGCNTHQTVPLNMVRRPKATPIHELERYMRCKECSAVRRYAFKRSQLIALRSNKITAESPPSEMAGRSRLAPMRLKGS